MEWIKEFETNEQKNIASIFSFMSYNPSIGRALKKGGSKLFKETVIKRFKVIEKIKTKMDFDKFHDDWCKELISLLKNSKGNQVSYGQAQKAINVFLKIYIDWAEIPENSKELKLFLHVPLDSRLIKFMEKNLPQKYKDEIFHLYGTHKFYQKCQRERIININKEIYETWQKIFREIYPQKPVLLDMAWFNEKEKQNDYL